MQKRIGVILIAMGVLVVIVGGLLDVIRGQAISLGPSQILIMGAGLMLAGGGFLIHRRGLRRVELGMLVGSVLVSLLLVEVALRIISQVDDDGQVTVLSTRLLPYSLALSSTADLLDAYQQAESPFLIYDPDLGWAPAPNAVSADGLYHTNSDAIRGTQTYPREPDPEMVRIAVFGDSFTFGTDLAEEDTWAVLLEEKLRAEGLTVEVLNFGMGGYGMDQAYLRYLHLGQDFNPDIVVFGLRTENAARNLNVVRSIYAPQTGIPFSKPRFVLEDGELVVVNEPTVPPDQMVDLLRDFERSPLSDYEYYYDPALYGKRWWLNSRLVSMVVTLGGDTHESPDRSSEALRIEHEGGQIALAIIEAFARDVEAAGGQFVIVDLDAGDAKSSSQALRSYLIDHYDFVETASDFDGLQGSQFTATRHFSRVGTEIIAENLATHLAPLIEAIREP